MMKKLKNKFCTLHSALCTAAKPRRLYTLLSAVCVMAIAVCILLAGQAAKAPEVASNTVLTFEVGDFPAYNDIQPRAIGTADAGKTAWEDGDQLIVTVSGNNMADQSLTLTLSIDAEGKHSWTPDKTIKYDKKVTPTLTVTAIYAPCYEVDADGNKVLKEGMQLGMTEYLVAHCDETDGKVTISFDGVTRNYSRLRIAGAAENTYTVTTTGFTPVGNGTAPADGYSLTTDEIGNAYLYGTFAKDATVTVKVGETELRKHTFTGATENAKSYVLDARPAYTYDETTKTYTVYSAEGLYAWLEAVQNDLTLNLTLMADITLPNKDLTTSEEITVADGVPSGSNWTPMGGLSSGPYTGIVEGNSYTITGLRISSTTDATGFIGFLEGNADTGTGEVRNLTLADAVVYSTAKYVGGIAGYNKAGTISNCTFGSSTTDGSSVSSTDIYGWVGGIVGGTSGTVTSCTNNGTVLSSGTTVWAGGIVGYTSGGTVSGCTNNGTVSASGGSKSTVGGIVGQSMSSSTISGCTNNGDVSATDTPEAYVGGIVGWNENSTVSGCTNKGDASATDCTQSYAGGIVGNNDSNGTVEDNNINNGTPTTNVGNG